MPPNGDMPSMGGRKRARAHHMGRSMSSQMI
jgi:hypothetical protein